MDRTNEAMIRLDGVSKRYDDGTVAVDDLDFDVTQGHLVALVGPSGCGKTTTLKMVNRLIEPSGGRIIIDGEDVTTVDPVALRRRIGYVIQNAGLFPHRSILDNVTTVPQLLDWDQARMRTRGMELLELVGLDPDTYASRYPHQLSGGQRQRVGVARALAADPPVLLMDEPFGAVDPVVRERLQSEFIRLQAEVRKTIMFVTHDIEEAVRLSDKVAVFAQGGKLMQYDSPGTILGAPSSEFVADFVGADRALKRLSVTTIDDISLERPPVVHLDDRLAFAGARLRSAGSRWGVVLDDREGLHGWVRLESTEREGRVSDAARRMDAWVPVGSSLKHAFSMMLQHDAGWVAVLDGERYLGVLTPATLHEALRRSVETEAGEADRDTVVVESVNSA